MRSASQRSLRGAVAALALAAAGCSTVSDGMSAMKGAVSSGASSGSSGPSTAAAAPVRPPPPVYDTQINPATQRAIHDASRALRSGCVDEAERAYRAIAQANPELGGPHAN